MILNMTFITVDEFLHCNLYILRSSQSVVETKHDFTSVFETLHKPLVQLSMLKMAFMLLLHVVKSQIL